MADTAKTTCPNCLELAKRITELESRLDPAFKRIEQLEALLRQNSRNSSKPPSSDPPGVPEKPGPKRRKKPGAQKGHKPHLREPIPPEKVNRRREIEPEVCPDCDSERFVESGEATLKNTG